MTEMSVEPYREIVLDKDGDGPAGQADRLARSARGCTDLVVFAHGWNNSPSVATRFYSAFFAPFPGLAGEGVRLGYAGVVWPSMMFSDEPVPDFATLAATVPGKAAVVARLAELVGEEPADEAAFAEFGALLRELTDTADTADTGGQGLRGADPEVPDFLLAEPLAMCARFAAAGDAEATAEATGDAGGAGAPDADGAEGAAERGEGRPAEERLLGGDRVKRLWKGAREALRQATYYTMKRRAGVVGARGLGPLLGELARTAPGLRVHLAGHSFGARLVCHAVLGLPEGTRTVKSVTLLQGAFSHYAFATRLPHAPGRGGSLPDLQRRVDGPLVACHSRHDTALRVYYPLASRLSRDDDAILGQDDRRWWAVGYDGIQAVPGTAVRDLRTVLREGLPASGCVSVDTAEVVSEHSDVCRPELARVVARAGRFGR
ncbi:serine-threonine protein kinase [Streptomyces sp. NPDC058740]|uniref:serine-threonine protein kinase n=1 Tax=Streptomyces sp. NPDC058740 TaxID=3346619 RepID=UPI00369D53E6